MRPLLALAAIALLCGVTACGGTAGGAGTRHAVKHDRDDDGDNNDDDAKVLDYGHAAAGAERTVLIAFVRRYYRAAAAEDGAEACSMLYPFIAEAVAEDYSHNQALKGPTCAAVMSKLFAQDHRLLSGESATLGMYALRVDGQRALAVLSFAVLPEIRQLVLRRDGEHWKAYELLDSIVE